MVWETVKSNGEKVLAFNYWPRPVNWVKNISVLVCTQDTFMMQIELAFNLAAAFFWSNLLPSPREIERKVVTGGYRCGFYLDIPIKSPIEILWGAGTARMIAEIASPFARGLFFWWAVESSIEALASFGTLLYPQYQCVDEVGDGMRKMDKASIPNGHTEGGVGLGELVFDRYSILSPTTAHVTFPAGYWKVQVCWAVQDAPGAITAMQVGLRQDLGPLNMVAIPVGDGSPIHWAQVQWEGHSEVPLAISAHFISDRPAGLPILFATCTYFIVSWSPTPLPPGHDLLPGPGDKFPDRQYPDCLALLDLLT